VSTAAKLRHRAAAADRSLAAEVRRLLRAALDEDRALGEPGEGVIPLSRQRGTGERTAPTTGTVSRRLQGRELTMATAPSIPAKIAPRPNPPDDLQASGRELWATIIGDLAEGWELDARELHLLRRAFRCADEIAALEVSIDRGEGRGHAVRGAA